MMAGQQPPQIGSAVGQLSLEIRVSSRVLHQSLKLVANCSLFGSGGLRKPRRTELINGLQSASPVSSTKDIV
jgi:hypothetical protein